MPANSQSEHLEKEKDEIVTSALVADDVTTNRLIAKRHLFTLFGKSLKVVEAEDGVVACNAVEKQFESDKHNFDIIIMDHLMPNLDGEKATQRIRSYEKEHHAKPSKIYTWSETYKGVNGETLFAGSDDRLDKPFNSQQAAKVLKAKKQLKDEHQQSASPACPRA